MLRADWVGALARSHNPVRGTLRGHSLLSRVPDPSQSVSARTPGYVWDLVLASSGGQTPVPTVPPTPTLGLLPPPKGDHCSGRDRRGASPRRALCRLPSSRPLPGLPPPAAPESAGPPAAPGPKGQATCSSSLQRASCRSCDQGPPGAGRGPHASRNGAPALGGGAQPVPPSRSEARPLSAVGSGGLLRLAATHTPHASPIFGVRIDGFWRLRSRRRRGPRSNPFLTLERNSLPIRSDTRFSPGAPGTHGSAFRRCGVARWEQFASSSDAVTEYAAFFGFFFCSGFFHEIRFCSSFHFPFAQAIT